MEYLSFQISVVQISLEHALFLCTSCFSSNSHFHMLYLHSKYGYVFFEITTSAVAVSYKPSFPHYGTPSLLNPSALQGNCYLVQPYCLVHSVIWAMLNQSEMEKPEDVCLCTFMTFYFLCRLISSSFGSQMRAIKSKYKSNIVYHSRQLLPLSTTKHKSWLPHSAATQELIAPCGLSLLVEQSEMTC